jgi:hypothetical integral membrane protein (TIGR02206 family)
VFGVATPTAYVATVALGAALCTGLCVAARRRPGPWTPRAARLIGLVLLADAVSYVVALVVAGTFSWSASLPLALCDMAVIVAGVACFTLDPRLVELTYFWGLAGTLQGVLTPDLGVGFPHLVFFQYVVGHVAIVTAALFLVVGMRIEPRPGAVRRVFAITVGYALFVGLIDAVSGADYMYLRAPPGEWTLLRLLGPWPWYLVSATGVAFVLLVLLDLPFVLRRHHGGAP